MSKICKGKNCNKLLKEGYKYNKCEACRNKNNGKIKTIIKGITAAGVVVVEIGLLALNAKNKTKNCLSFFVLPIAVGSLC